MIGRTAVAVLVIAGSTVVPATASQIFAFKVPSGPVIRMTVTIAATHPKVKGIEACRKTLGARPLTYILVTLDNRKGTEEFRLHGASIVTNAGRTIRPKDIPDVIGDWPDGKTVSVYNRCNVDLYNAWMNNADVLPGARSSTVLATTAKIPSVKNIWATPGTPGDGFPRIRKL